MNMMTTAALFFLAAGIFTSVTILSAYQILFTLPLIYFTYIAFKNKEFKLPLSAWFLLAFTAVALLSLIVNYDLIPKPSKNFGRLKYFIFGIGGIFVLRAWLESATDQTKKIILNTFFLSIVVAGLFSIYQCFFLGVKRAEGLTETMRYGYGAGMAITLILGAHFHRHKLGKWFDYPWAILALAFGSMGMYLTFTRGALLGFICALPVIMYFFKRKLGVLLGLLAILGIIGLGTIYFFGTEKYKSRYLSNKDNSSDIKRRSQWKAAIIATQEKPILGWGLSNFHSQLARIKEQYDLEAKQYNDAHSHNIFLEVASGTGLIGLFFFSGWIFFWAWESYRGDPLTRALIIPFGVALVVSSQFEVTFDANNASMIFALYAFSKMSLVNLKNET